MNNMWGSGDADRPAVDGRAEPGAPAQPPGAEAPDAASVERPAVGSGDQADPLAERLWPPPSPPAPSVPPPLPAGPYGPGPYSRGPYGGRPYGQGPHNPTPYAPNPYGPGPRMPTPVNYPPARTPAPVAYPQARAPAPNPPTGYPTTGHPAGPPRRSETGLPAPVAVRPVEGTPFMVAIVGVPPTLSGRAVASLVAGIGSILVSTVVGCFGLLGGQDGWGPMVAGAFALLALFGGVASVILGRMALREHRRLAEPERPRGRGLALAGVICGSTGLGLTVLCFLLALSLTVAG